MSTYSSFRTLSNVMVLFAEAGAEVPAAAPDAPDGGGVAGGVPTGLGVLSPVSWIPRACWAAPWTAPAAAPATCVRRGWIASQADRPRRSRKGRRRLMMAGIITTMTD